MTRRRLCKFAEAVLAAEARRAKAEKALALAEAELHEAFNALFEDYLRAPVSLQIDRMDAKKAQRVIAAWHAHNQRRTRALFENVKCLWPALPPSFPDLHSGLF